MMMTMMVIMLAKFCDYVVYTGVLFLLFWNVQIAGLLYVLRFLDFTRPRGDLLRWSTMMKRFFRIRFFLVGSERLQEIDMCIYLCNHRSWSDFFVEQYLANGRTCALSRMMVFIALPVFMSYGYLLRSMFFFRRNAIKNKEKFNEWLDERLKRTPYNGLIVYPEGHRNTSEKSLPLKKGMLRYAYLRKIPCQVILGKNKELPFSEKQWKVRFGVHIFVAYSRLIDPSQFEEFEDFFKEVQTVWNDQWNKVYAVQDSSGLTELKWVKETAFDFPFRMRVELVVGMMVGMVMFFIMLYGMGWMVYSLVRLTGGITG